MLQKCQNDGAITCGGFTMKRIYQLQQAIMQVSEEAPRWATYVFDRPSFAHLSLQHYNTGNLEAELSPIRSDG